MVIMIAMAMIEVDVDDTLECLAFVLNTIILGSGILVLSCLANFSSTVLINYNL